MEDTTSLTNTIIQTINTIFQSLFSSIDNNVYEILDHLTFINPSILKESFLEKLIGSNASNGLLLLANSLLFRFFSLLCHSFNLFLLYEFTSGKTLSISI